MVELCLWAGGLGLCLAGSGGELGLQRRRRARSSGHPGQACIPRDRRWGARRESRRPAPCPPLVSARKGHRCSLLGKLLRGDEADAGVGAGDDHAAAVEILAEDFGGAHEGFRHGGDLVVGRWGQRGWEAPTQTRSNRRETPKRHFLGEALGWLDTGIGASTPNTGSTTTISPGFFGSARLDSNRRPHAPKSTLPSKHNASCKWAKRTPRRENHDFPDTISL